VYSPRLISATLEVMKCVDDKLGFDSTDLVVFVTDGAPATCGRNVGSFPVLEKFVGRQINKPYCIIHPAGFV